MLITLRWIRLALNFCFFCFFIATACYHKTTLYILQQAKGQFSILMNTVLISEYKRGLNNLGTEHENITLIEAIKKFSIDTLAFKPTDNFTTVYNNDNEPVLWIITASDPYAFKPYHWWFPLVGEVSYKGFFKKNLADIEYNRLVSLGYDVDLRSATAWSTLGWFKDPLLSATLKKSKGSFCNLLFHELFHATYYAPGSVDLNENLANFIAHQATLAFLRNDSANLNQYLNKHADEEIYNRYVLRSKKNLEQYYLNHLNDPQKPTLKLLALIRVADSIKSLPLHNRPKFIARRKDILQFKNAYFIGFQQYERMQDSLQFVFNKIYKGNLKKLVLDLKLNKINY
jgi:predicted aminopeptidase